MDWIQLRDRNASDHSLWRCAGQLVAARDACAPSQTGPSRPRVIVNKRTDLALAVGADGVHLGFDALEARDCRALLATATDPTARSHCPTQWLGASLHDEAEVAAAVARQDEAEVAAAVARQDEAEVAFDYAHLAPIWPPLSKPATRPPLGPERLAHACAAGLPLLAQGGIDAARAAEAIRAGAAGIAVTGILTRTSNPQEAIGPLREALDLAV